MMQINAAALAPEAALHYLFPVNPDASRLTVTCPQGDYSASRIARAVEDADAHLLNLNVTAAIPGDNTPAGYVTVELRVSHRFAGAVARSLERYGFTVIAVSNAAGADINTARDRVNELIHYLDV